MLGSERILTLDIGAATIKLAEFQSTKACGLRLVRFHYSELGVEPDRDENRDRLVTAAIGNALREWGIHAGGVGLTVSGQSVFTRFVKLPPVNESKVAQIIQYEAQQNVPFPIDEVVWDYQLLGSTPQGELEVVLLAIKSDIIEQVSRSVESAGLRTGMVDVAPMALANAVRYNYGGFDGCTMVLDIGARTTNLLFLESERIFSRAIPIAGNAVTQSIASEFNVPFCEAETMKKAKGFVALGGAYEDPSDETQARISKIVRNVMTKLHAEVARSISFYRSQQGGGHPSRVLLSGGGAILPYTDRFFQEKLQATVEYLNPFRNVEVAPSVSREELGRCAHFFGELVGLGLRKVMSCPVEVNLLPKSVCARQQRERRYPYLAGAAACVCLIPLCGWLYTRNMVALEQMQLDAVRFEVGKLQMLSQQISLEQKQLSSLKCRADEVVGLVDQRFFWPQLLQEISTKISSNMWITSLEPVTVSDSGLTPVSSRAPARIGGRGRVRIEDESSTQSGGQPVSVPHILTSVRIQGSGRCASSGEMWEQANGFLERLRKSSVFDPAGIGFEGKPKQTGKEKELFTFTASMKLAKPIAF